MDRILGIFGALTIILVLVTAGMVATATNTPKGIASPDDALKIARIFITNEDTYKFDGMAGTLMLNVTGTFPEPGKYEVTGEFTSAHSGFGNRMNMMVLQVLTDHKCVIMISDGQVQSAVMDGSFDMVTQKPMQNPTQNNNTV